MVILPYIRRKYMVSRIPKGATVPMSECVVTLASDRAAYTGSARTVGVTVTWEGETLTVNVDYTLSYANNTNIGPATVTVTGMGQFSGSVTKTFYVVMGSNVPWDFSIANAQRVGTKSVANLNGGHFISFLDTHPSGGILIGAAYVYQQHMKGLILSRDENDEFHIANMDTSGLQVLDESGAGESDYSYLVATSLDGKNTYWANNSSSSYLKQKSGSAFSFSGMTLHGTSSDLGLTSTGALYNRLVTFANGGRLLFIDDGPWTMRRYSLSTPYDITTIDWNSVSAQAVPDFSGNNRILALVFDFSGTVALMSVSERKYLYQLSLSIPFDLTSASTVSTLNLTSDTSGYAIFSGLHVVNDGKTLFGLTSGGIAEFSLSSSS